VRAEVPLALTVPPDAVPGDAAGEIVAVGGGEEVRVPVRVRIGGPKLAALTVEDVEISGGTIRYALVNRGNAMLEPGWRCAPRGCSAHCWTARNGFCRWSWPPADGWSGPSPGPTPRPWTRSPYG
jgi:hypothetical protein